MISAVMAKLMYNSILRALIQTYLFTSINMWFSLNTSDLSNSEGVIDLIMSIVILVALNIGFPVFCYKFLTAKFEDLPDK